MKRFLVFVVIICMAFLLVSAQEQPTDDMNDNPNEVKETYIPEPVQPVPEPITRLKVTMIDEMNDQFIKLENCMVHVRGKLHIAEDTFDYTNTFIEGDRYEIIIHVKLKK